MKRFLLIVAAVGMGTVARGQQSGTVNGTYWNSDYLWVTNGVSVKLTAGWSSATTLYVSDSLGGFAGNLRGGQSVTITLVPNDAGSYAAPSTGGQDVFTAYQSQGGTALGTFTENYTLTQSAGGTYPGQPATDSETFNVTLPQTQISIVVPYSDSDATKSHNVVAYVGGNMVGFSVIGPAANGQTLNGPATFSAAASAGESWSVYVDATLDANGNPEPGTGTVLGSGTVAFGENSTVDTVDTGEEVWSGATPTPTPTPSPTPTPTPSPTPTATPTPTPSPTASPTPSEPIPTPTPGPSTTEPTPTPPPLASPTPPLTTGTAGLTGPDIYTAVKQALEDAGNDNSGMPALNMPAIGGDPSTSYQDHSGIYALQNGLNAMGAAATAMQNSTGTVLQTLNTDVEGIPTSTGMATSWDLGTYTYPGGQYHLVINFGNLPASWFWPRQIELCLLYIGYLIACIRLIGAYLT